MIFNTNLDISIESDITCFTDSNLLFPEEVEIWRTNSKYEEYYDISSTDSSSFSTTSSYGSTHSNFRRQFEIKGTFDGYYWCLSINPGEYAPNESERVLFIKNTQPFTHLSVIIVEQKEFYERFGIEFKNDTVLYKFYCPNKCDDRNATKVVKLPEDDFSEAKKFPISRFYSDKIIFHGVKKDFIHIFQDNLNFFVSRPILFCEANESIPRFNTGEMI